MLLRRRSGGAATSLLYLVPPVTALLGVPLLGQSVGGSVFLGMAVSGVEVVLVIVRQRPQAQQDLAWDDPASDHDPNADSRTAGVLFQNGDGGDEAADAPAREVP